MLEQGLSRRPIVLLGDVGVGKTTFIRHLLSVEAKDDLADALVLYVNFGSEPALRSDLERYVAEQFSLQLIEKYGVDIYAADFVRAAYNGELNRFRRGIFGALRESEPREYLREELKLLSELTAKPEAHLRRALAHLRGSLKKNAVVFFDNIDQRPDNFQEQVYLIAQAMADTWRLPTFVTLRPATYNRSKRNGPLSGYQPRVFTISPPRIDQVILKRLRFALVLIENEWMALRSSGISVDSSTLRDYVTVIIQSFERNRDLGVCLDNISAGNVRRALDALNAFIGSGHVDTHKLLQLYRKTGHYTIALHEFLRALIYGEHEYFDPSSSFVPNVLDLEVPDIREHFLKPIILTYALKRSEGRQADRGFLEASSVYSHVSALGFTSDQIDKGLLACLDRSLLESSDDDPQSFQVSGSPMANQRVRVTQRGAYTVERLMRTFVYYDAIFIDTPVLDSETRVSLGLPFAIEGRLERAEKFVAYLDESWVSTGFTPECFDWPLCVQSVRAEIASVRTRLEAAAGRTR